MSNKGCIIKKKSEPDATVKGILTSDMFFSREFEYVRHWSSSISTQIPLSLQFLRTLSTLVPFTAPYTQEALRESSAGVVGHLKLPRVVLVTSSGQ